MKTSTTRFKKPHDHFVIITCLCCFHSSRTHLGHPLALYSSRRTVLSDWNSILGASGWWHIFALGVAVGSPSRCILAITWKCEPFQCILAVFGGWSAIKPELTSRAKRTGHQVLQVSRFNPWALYIYSILQGEFKSYLFIKYHVMLLPCDDIIMTWYYHVMQNKHKTINNI